MTFQELKQKDTIPPITSYRKYEKNGFNTPSGKVEIYSDLLKKWNFDPLPSYREPPETFYSDPKLAKDYPLLFTSSHEDDYLHSQDRHLESLRKKKPDPVVIIHPDTAAGLGIKDGDLVYIETKRGRIRQKAVLDDTLDPRVVSAGLDWWFPEAGPSNLYNWEESNINILTDDEPPYNPEMGSTNLRGFLCRVYKA
jgi:anaerobic selenocysteine-containing dehydrogenase